MQGPCNRLPTSRTTLTTFNARQLLTGLDKCVGDAVSMFSIPNLACSAGKDIVAPMPASAPAALYRLSVVSSMPLHFK